MDTITSLETGAAALLFVAMFLLGGRIRPFRALTDPRGLISFGAGMSTAYVFVYLMPELHSARRAVVESASVTLRYQGKAIYFLALVGFLVFYGLNHFRTRLREGAGADAGLVFKLDIGGFAAYVWVMAYLLVHSLEPGPVAIGLYSLAISFHFLALDHTLRTEHGAAYRRRGRWVLAAMAILGWGTGMLFALPHAVLPLLVAFISGAIIMNSCIMELPTEKEGRFVWFAVGGLVYGAILLPLE